MADTAVTGQRFRARSALLVSPPGHPALLRRGAAARGGRSALLPALARAGVAFLLAAAGTRFLAAARFLVDRRPGARLRLLLADAAILIAFGDVLRLALLLAGIRAFVSARHLPSPSRPRAARQRLLVRAVPNVKHVAAIGQPAKSISRDD